MREIRIFGMRRSGNHPIIEWIASHFAKTTHFNDCCGWENPIDNGIYNYLNDKQDLFDNELVIYSYEDFCPSENEIKDERTFIILRDWYNMMSSRIVTSHIYDRLKARHPHKREYDNINIAEVWLQFAKLSQSYPNKSIMYNQWIQDKNYRETLQKTIDINSSYDTFTLNFPISGIGFKSSFEDQSLDINRLNNRYKESKSINFDSYGHLSNNEIKKLCKEIFHIELPND